MYIKYHFINIIQKTTKYDSPTEKQTTPVGLTCGHVSLYYPSLQPENILANPRKDERQCEEKQKLWVLKVGRRQPWIEMQIVSAVPVTTGLGLSMLYDIYS